VRSGRRLRAAWSENITRRNLCNSVSVQLASEAPPLFESFFQPDVKFVLKLPDTERGG
jgi:hypothetical protein